MRGSIRDVYIGWVVGDGITGKDYAKFRLETNSIVVWLYAGSVNLIFPDVQFGTVSQDWVTYKQCQVYKVITQLLQHLTWTKLEM